jgi:Na+/glutamate symporter
MLVSAVVMALAGLASKRTKKRWITDYALPVSLVAGMIAAIPITAWLS